MGRPYYQGRAAEARIIVKELMLSGSLGDESQRRLILGGREVWLKSIRTHGERGYEAGVWWYVMSHDNPPWSTPNCRSPEQAVFAALDYLYGPEDGEPVF